MDSYALCPCGSGKKVKFCCQAILPEMGKIERFQENNQPRMALQLIDKLLKDHPDNPWLVNQRAMSLIADQRHEEARDSLVAFLRKQPEHPLTNGLLALAVTELEPIDQCKKVIHRAFLKSMAAEPRIVAILAAKLVDHYLTSGKDMAARQHMAVVLRLEREDQRQNTLMAMLELDADNRVPYPLRGAHPLPTYEPPEELAAQYKKVQRLYVHACFSEAADLLEQIAQQDESSPELWHMIGLMRAWDGDEGRAAEALHRAAQLYQDTDTAVDVEAIAQLLSRRQPENTIAARVRVYEVESLARLLTRLDNEDRVSRIPVTGEPGFEHVSAAYEVLDRPLPLESEYPDLTLDTVPRSIGQLTLFDRTDGDECAYANVNGLEGEQLDQAIQIFEAAAGELAKPTQPDEDADEDYDVVGWYSKDDMALTESAYFPPTMPAGLRNQLRRDFVKQRILEIWLNTPQAALGDRSPLDAAQDESAKVPLSAALRVFDSFLDRQNVILDQQEIRERLHVSPPSPIIPEENTDLNAFSVSQLERLQTDQLSDEDFERLMQRVLVVRHSGLEYRLLKEFLDRRTHLVAQRPEEAEQAYATLADICRRSLRIDEALDWIERGFQFSKARSASFETLLTWKMRELSLRAHDLESPEFKEVLLELWNHYGAKLPAVRARLDEFVQSLKIEAPWENAILTPQSGEGTWTAETEQTSGSEKKLWLPD